MGLELASFIADLNVSWPLGTDPKSEGDNHLRNIKSCLQSQFPNLGNTVAVLPTATEMNYLQGVTSPIQTQLNNATPTVIGQRFIGRAPFPGNGRWTFIGGSNDAALILRDSASDALTGSWVITGLTTPAHNTVNAGAHGHSVTGSGSGTTGNNNPTSNVVDFDPGIDGNPAHDHDFSVNITGSAAAVPDHFHTVGILTVASTGAWRPRTQDCFTMERAS